MARHTRPWRRLVNTAASQDGSIHDDRQARELGFRGALVPGSVVASAAMPLILERYGAPWMEGGWFTFTFMSPVYDIEQVQASAEDAGTCLNLQITSREGRVSCTGEAGVGSAAPWIQNEPEWHDVFPDLERGFAFPVRGAGARPAADGGPAPWQVPEEGDVIRSTSDKACFSTNARLISSAPLPIATRFDMVSVPNWRCGGRLVASLPRCLVLALLLFSAACGGSDDEGLDDLELSQASLTPGFDPDRFEYAAEVGNDVDSIVVTATAADSGATLTVNGGSVTSGSASPPIPLAVGENTVTVVVTEDDGDTATYTVLVTRLPPPSDNPALASLELTVADLDQIFDSDITSYTAFAGHFGASTRVVAEPEEPRAQMELEGESLTPGERSPYVPLSTGTNTVALTVTAEDGSAERTYEVEVSRAERNTLRQEAYLKASNTGPDEFGTSVGISRHTLLVGAPGEGSAATGVGGDETDDSFADAGAAYVFDRSGSSWVQTAYLKASNSGGIDRFGGAVGMDGDLLAVGATGEQSLATGIDGDEDDDSGTGVGAVYAFERDGMGVWEQIAYLKASNAGSGDAFGAALDVDRARLIVGAWSEDSDAVGVNGDGDNDVLPGSGAAYVFARDGSGWREEAYLKASNTDGQDEFGRAVAISSSTAAVGAPREDSAAIGIGGDESDNSRSATGAVYVFEADEDNGWAQAAYVKASNTDAGDAFGEALALDGDLLAVGAPGEDSDADGIDGDEQNDFLEGAGAVYVFERDADGAWSQMAYVKASNPGSNDGFGSAVALSGNVLVVGAPGENSGATRLDGDEQDNSLPDSGAVYVFERDATGVWRQVSYVKASNTDSGDELGGSIAFDGDSLLIGAALEDGGDTGVDGDDADDSIAGAGAAYVVR